jgi:hypothetical protein
MYGFVESFDRNKIFGAFGATPAMTVEFLSKCVSGLSTS